jgi:hypothetical protein
MISTLKGLYYFTRATKRVIIPLTAGGWKTLTVIAKGWKSNFPEPLEFGSFLAIEKEAMNKPGTVANAMDLINWQHKHTIERLAAFSYFPDGKRTIVETGSYEEVYCTVGWKQTFYWKPLC